MPPKLERITECAQFGDSPHWDSSTQSLYFVDITGKTINRYHPASKKHTKATIGINTVSVIIPVEEATNKFLITLGRELVTIKWDGKTDKVTEVIKLCQVDDDEDTLDNRFNSGKCDQIGRLWIGTMSKSVIKSVVKPEKGGLFTLNANNVVKKHLSHVTLSNGISWNEELKKMYYIDSPKCTIDEYDIDLKHGSLSDGKAVFTLEKHDIPGFPSGMAIDKDGNLWVAIFDANRVIKINPRIPETLLETIEIPAKQVTSLAFGGDNLDELYVTSAACLDFTKDGVKLPPPNHGATFRVTGIGAKGYAGVKVKL